MNDGANLIAVNIGNSAISFAHFSGDEAQPLRRFLHAQIKDAADAIVQVCNEGAVSCEAIVIASVHEPMRNTFMDIIIPRVEVELYRVGEDVPVPISHTLSDSAIAGTGQDRLLNALAAHRASNGAAVVVDAGSAITVDFVDGEGTFHGGAIAPGARIGLRALHNLSSALPSLELQAPDDEPFGHNTTQAMLQGMMYGAQGLVHRLLERYAEKAGFYPPVIATGGDAALLFDTDPIIERIVPDLTHRGIAFACREALADDVSA